MELRKRGAYWSVDLRDASGARVRRTTGKTDKREAQKVAAGMQAAVWATQEQGQGGRAAITLADATQRYVNKLTREKKASSREASSIRTKTLGQMPGRWGLPVDLMLHDLTADLLDTLVTQRSAEGNSAQTIAHELKMLRASNLHAKAINLRVSPVTKWPLPKTEAKTRYLTLDEYRALVAALDPAKASPAYRDEWQDAQDLVVALTMTGGRWMEVAGVTWGQVGAPTWGECRLWGNKTRKERMAPVTQALQGLLQRRYDSPRRHPTLVFPSASGGLRKGSCVPILRAMDRCGFNSDPAVVAKHGEATVHSLRHTFASWLLQDGAGLSEVQDMLGHATVQMTRRYAHLEKAVVAARMADRLNALAQG